MTYIEALKKHKKKLEIKLASRGESKDIEYELSAVNAQILRYTTNKGVKK